MPIFNQCCCCCSLPTGGIILGILGAIRAAFGIAIPIISLFNLNEVVEKAKAENESQGKPIDLPDTLSSDDSDSIVKVIFQIILWIVLIINLIDFCVAILLIIGAKRSRRGYILPYLITDGLGIIISVTYFIVAGVNSGQLVHGLIVAAIVLLISGYLWLCVLSLYQWIKETSRPPTTVRSPYPEQQAVYSTMAKN